MWGMGRRGKNKKGSAFLIYGFFEFRLFCQIFVTKIRFFLKTFDLKVLIDEFSDHFSSLPI